MLIILVIVLNLWTKQNNKGMGFGIKLIFDILLITEHLTTPMLLNPNNKV
jgi:hypothetical protein